MTGTDSTSEALRKVILHANVTDGILGAFFDVYNELGVGFVEPVYQRSLEIRLRERGLDARREVPIRVHYHDAVVGVFRPDFLVERSVIVEIKAVEAFARGHELQLLNYLRATQYEVGLLLNFGPKAVFRRFIFSNERKTHPRGQSVPIRGSL